VIRFDHAWASRASAEADPGEYFTVTKVVPTEEDARNEVARLNAIAKEGDTYYLQATRYIAGD
jgi:hypothetical protein